MIGDLIQDVEIMSKQQIEEKFLIRTINPLDYLRIRNLITKFMRMNNFTIDPLYPPIKPLLPQHLSIVIKHQKGSKDIYKSYTQKKRL